MKHRIEFSVLLTLRCNERFHSVLKGQEEPASSIFPREQPKLPLAKPKALGHPPSLLFAFLYLFPSFPFSLLSFPYSRHQYKSPSVHKYFLHLLSLPETNIWTMKFLMPSFGSKSSLINLKLSVICLLLLFGQEGSK